jgi:hypothetical protein
MEACRTRSTPSFDRLGRSGERLFSTLVSLNCSYQHLMLFLWGGLTPYSRPNSRWTRIMDSNFARQETVCAFSCMAATALIAQCITWIMHQQLWGYKVEEKLYLGVREQNTLNTTALTYTKHGAWAGESPGNMLSPTYRTQIL